MKHIYLKPQLENLSQGERIAFVRQFRRMTQDEVSDKLGLDGENKRRSMARYESGDRKPKENRLLEIASILKESVLQKELLKRDKRYIEQYIIEAIQNYNKTYTVQLFTI